MIKSIYLLSLFLLIVSCSSELEDIENIEENEIMLLFAERTSISSDGIESTEITARVPKDTELIAIDFKTSKGKFLRNNQQERNVPADSTAGKYRYAKVILLSDTISGTAYVESRYKNINRFITINFE